MRRLMMVAGLFVYGAIALAGCSPSSSETVKIDGMSPGEYRDKADLSRAVPPKSPKTRSARR
jgi:outer membrane protein assembly factor BamE (lipoprotein component of BamABCDE complex)